jgi:hypothetical protein
VAYSFTNASFCQKHPQSGGCFQGACKDGCRLWVELGHEFIVRCCIFTLEVLHQAATFTHFFDQTTARRVVFFVGLQVLDKFVHFGGEKRDLNLWRTRIRWMGLKLFDQLLFLCWVQHRVVLGQTVLCFQAQDFRLWRSACVSLQNILNVRVSTFAVFLAPTLRSSSKPESPHRG